MHTYGTLHALATVAEITTGGTGTQCHVHDNLDHCLRSLLSASNRVGKLLMVVKQRELRKALQVSPTADMIAEERSWDIEDEEVEDGHAELQDSQNDEPDYVDGCSPVKYTHNFHPHSFHSKHRARTLLLALGTANLLSDSDGLCLRRWGSGPTDTCFPSQYYRKRSDLQTNSQASRLAVR